MAQFIRKNINIISSKSTSKPPSRDTLESLDQSDVLDVVTLTPIDPHGAHISTGLSSIIFQNYPTSSHQTSTSNVAEIRTNRYQDELTAHATQDVSITSLGKDTIDATSQSFRSANESLPDQRDQSGRSRVRFDNEPQREPYQEHTTYSSLTDEIHSDANTLIGNTSTYVEQSLVKKAWNKFRYISERRWLNRRRLTDDIENQPLISPGSNHGYDSIDGNDREVGDLEDVEHQDENTLFGVDKILLFRIAGVIAGLTVTIIILTSGDQQLLVKVFKAIFCYVFGTNISRLFGRDFCEGF